MDQVTLTIHVTEEYRQRMNEAKTAEDLRKCRAWIDLLGAVGEMAEVEVNRNCVILRVEDRQARCTHDQVLALTEMKNGILLRLSHKRFLFLPITEDAQNNERVMHAMMLLSAHCRYVFRAARLRLPGVRFANKLGYHTRPRQGYYTGDNFIKGAMIVLVCISLFAGTIFATQPIRNRKIGMREAQVKSGTFERADPAYRRGNLQYIDLEFLDAEGQTIDGCCVRQELEDQIKQIPEGTKMRLLVHPKSNSVLQLEVDSEILLDFDYAQEKLWNEAIGFLCLGLFLYAVTAFLIMKMVRKKL